LSSCCSVGSVLLQPNHLERFKDLSREDLLVEDLSVLIEKITFDQASGGKILEVLAEAAEPLGMRLLERAGGTLAGAVNNLRPLLEPLVPTIQELSTALADAADPDAAGRVFVDLLSRLGGATATLSMDKIRLGVDRALDVVNNDLGLTTAALEEEVWALLDDLIARIEAIQPPAEGSVPADTAEAIECNRLAVVAGLKRIRRQLDGMFSFPELNVEEISAALFAFLNSGGLPEVLTKLNCAGEALSAVAAVAQSVEEVVPYTGFGSGSVGGAEAPAPQADVQYLWYPSWVLADKGRETWHHMVGSWLPFVGTTGLQCWVDRTGSSPEIKLNEHRLFSDGTFNWAQIRNPKDALKGPASNAEAPLKYTFRSVSAESMESFARHSAWIADGLEAAFNVVGPSLSPELVITKGGSASATNVANLALSLGHGTFKIGKRMPYGFWAKQKADFGFWGSVLAATPGFVGFFPWTFQGFHTDADAWQAFKYWILLVIGDGANVMAAGAVPAMIRDLSLSILTVINFEGPGLAPAGVDNRPDNRSEVGGIVALFDFLGSMLLISLVFDRKDYGLLGGGTVAKLFLAYMLLGGLFFGLIGGLLGVLVAWTISGIAGAPVVDDKVVGLTLLKSAIAGCSPLKFLPMLYGLKENDTDGGKWDPRGVGFDGYQNHSTSPYKLPYAPGQNIMCFQGNLGLFSHNFTNPQEQVYAYDLMLDKGTEVLAARAGRVVDYFDWVPDNQDVDTTPPPFMPDGTTPLPVPVAGQTQNDNWNFIVVMHEGTPHAEHDRGPGGTASTTYAIYGHGLQGSVRSVFQGLGIAQANIIGTLVAQGQPIMLADSTGISFCNHVHMEVRNGPAPVPPAPASPWTPVMLNTIKPNSSIPFVFSDVTNLGNTDGVPRSRRFYESSNTRVP
jgi:hypothetical protein